MRGGDQPLADHPILIVDDEPDNRELLTRFLRRKYRPIHEASDGIEGLEILDSQRIDLILTDQRMPRLEGTELLRRAVDIQPRAIRILITGYGDIDTLTSAINDGHTYHIVNKPVELPILDMVVRRALDLYEANIRERELFDAFVHASVSAIEQRDPTTAGHSFRVAAMTTGLAMVVDGVRDGPLAGLRFSRDDIEQIKCASLLHDFGKIGVREAVLVKSHKLPPAQREMLLYRLGESTRAGRVDPERARVYRSMIDHLDDPSTKASGHVRELTELAEACFVEEGDLEYLRVERGSLSELERREIQSHVTGSINFLKQIPWPKRLGRVVDIAGSHHERLNGRGYPTGTVDIPVEAQMMAVCDVYDALVAADRPYKTAVSHQQAIEILWKMTAEGGLSETLLSCFIDRGVYRAMRRDRGGRPSTTH